MSEVVSKMFSRMSKMRPVPLEWAWKGLIPMGKLTLITGDPGVGKSLVALQVAAMMTRGVTMTPQSSDGVGSSAMAPSAAANVKRVPPRGVLVFSAADQAEDTVLPRLMAAGADTSQVFLFNGYMLNEPSDDGDVEDGENEQIPDEGTPAVRPFLLSRDIGELDWCLEELCDEGIDVGLIVIDSIDRYIGTSEKKSDRIEAVAKLADLAARSGAAVLVTANTSMKAGSRGGTVVYQELLNTARSVLLVAEDPEQPDRRLVLPVKHNLTGRPRGASFTVEQGVVRWGTEPVNLEGVGALVQTRWNPRRTLVRDDVHELDRATRWLEDTLRGGQVASDSIQHQATQVDISYGTLRRASKVLECKVRKQKNQWFWSLPDQMESERGDFLVWNDGSKTKRVQAPGTEPVPFLEDETGDRCAAEVMKERALVS